MSFTSKLLGFNTSQRGWLIGSDHNIGGQEFDTSSLRAMLRSTGDIVGLVGGERRSAAQQQAAAPGFNPYDPANMHASAAQIETDYGVELDFNQEISLEIMTDSKNKKYFQDVFTGLYGLAERNGNGNRAQAFKNFADDPTQENAQEALKLLQNSVVVNRLKEMAGVNFGDDSITFGHFVALNASRMNAMGELSNAQSGTIATTRDLTLRPGDVIGPGHPLYATFEAGSQIAEGNNGIGSVAFERALSQAHEAIRGADIGPSEGRTFLGMPVNYDNARHGRDDFGRD